MAFVVLAVFLFVAAMMANLDYDEEQYLAGAYFARDLSVYRDFISFQPPPYTWILGTMFDALDGWYLLAARIATWVFALGSCILLFSVLLSYGSGRICAFVLLLGFVTSPFTEGPLTLTRNDIMPLFFLLAGMRLFLSPVGEMSRSVARMFLGGFFLALAAATKYTYVFATPVFVAVLLYDEYVRRDAKRDSGASRTGWFVAGSALGVLPLVYSLATNCSQFVFSTLLFHLTAMPDWYRAQGLGDVLTLERKLKSLLTLTIRHGNATLLLIYASSAVALASSGSGSIRRVLQ